MRFIQYTFLVLFFCLLSSCALVKTAYNNAPQVLGWWLDDYFDFTQSQRKVLDPALQQLHDWHRQNQLSAYVETLKILQTAINKPHITPAEICENAEVFSATLKELQQKSIPIIIEMAPLLTDKQLHYFQTKLDKRAQKWKSEWWQESPEAQIEARLERRKILLRNFMAI